MANAFGIIASSGTHIKVEGLLDYRPIAAFSFLGRYRVIDFPISNMSNSDIDHIQVYIRRKPRSLVEHLGTGRHYNINSKKGRLQILFAQNSSENDVYNTDIAGYLENIEMIERVHQPYVIIAPSYMVYAANYDTLLQTHIDSGADITLLYHSVDNAKEAFLNCDILNLNKQKGVESIEKNRGSAKNRNIFMDTYICLLYTSQHFPPFYRRWVPERNDRKRKHYSFRYASGFHRGTGSLQGTGDYRLCRAGRLY